MLDTGVGYLETGDGGVAFTDNITLFKLKQCVTATHSVRLIPSV